MNGMNSDNKLNKINPIDSIFDLIINQQPAKYKVNCTDEKYKLQIINSYCVGVVNAPFLF